MSLKLALRVAAIACAMAVSIGAFAQSWPTKPIRLILGYPTGGATDAMARPLIAKIEPLLRQPVIIEYRPGAGATVGAQVAASAPPDGYSLHLLGAGELARRVDRVGEKAAGQAELRHFRRRRRRTHGGGTTADRRPDPDGARRLQGRRAGDDRSHRRPRAGALRLHGHGGAAYQVGQDQGARGDLGEPRAGDSRC